MKARYLLAIALVTGTVLAACGGDPDSLSNGRDGLGAETTAKKKKTTDTPSANDSDDGTSNDTTPSGPVATNSPAGKEFYKTNVHPVLSTTCGGCHGSAGPGPEWLTAADAEKSYSQLFK